MASINEHESAQIDRANASGKPPVMFIHGLWLLPSSWDNWATLFEEAGYTALTPGWPDDPETVGEAQQHPEVFANKSIKEVAGTSHRLPSGPLHDAAEVARAGIPTVMLFVQSLRGLSHTKLEDTKPEHLELAVRALDALATKTIARVTAQ